MNNYTAEIADRLKILRTAKKISQEKMADLLDITTSTYVKIERADQNITMKHLINICNILDVSADAIVFGRMSNTKSFNLDDFVLYSEFFSNEGLNKIIEIAKKILELKK